MHHAVACILVALLGCATAGGDPPGDDDALEDADAAVADPDAAPGSAPDPAAPAAAPGPAPDAAPPSADAGRLTAASLGDPCTSPAECPAGYSCLGVTT